MIDREIYLARALLVESNPLLRSVGVAQLRDIGVGHVAQAGKVRDARLMLESEPYDIVVCNREFEGSEFSGQDLLDELRRERLLPHSTVFLMVTARASYHQVVEAAESGLDGYLVRPYTAAQLAARLTEARHRKRELAHVLRALDAADTELALVRAMKRFQEQQAYGVYCGRLAAELLLGLQRHDEARRVFEHLALTKGHPAWALLGVARAMVAKGDSTAARKAVTDVLQADPQAADAHDLLGRILVEQCDFDGALVHYGQAAELTPGCLLRAQHAGALAFYQGQGHDAVKWLERTLGLGVQSKLFDALSLLLIAMLRYDAGDAPGVDAMLEQLRQFRMRFPDSRRLRRFERTADALTHLLAQRTEPAQQALHELAAEAGEDDFDLEAANMLLAVWARVPAAARPAGAHAALVEAVAMRFCVSKAMGEVLAASACRAEPALGHIRGAQARVASLAEQALDLALTGDPASAARQLLQSGEQTLNAKLLEMAAAIAKRHAALIPEATALCERAAAVLRRSCQTVNHIAGIQRSGRSPGGLQVRGPQPQEAAHATA